ncbi:MAG: LLM class F420-dependent oxidoreductase [Acidimicrobiia bacterium]
MRLSFKTVPQDTTWEPMRDVWLAADDIDVFSAGWNFDHFYPILQHDRTGPCFEGWTMLAALAGVTNRLRLGVMVTGNPYRHPAVLANMAASLDVIAGGRLELGIGAGWNEEESAAYGIDLPPLRERFDRLEEACAVLDLLLTAETSSFDGTYYRLTDARCEPKPVQRPRPPFVIGGGGEKRTLRIAARFADQWNLPGGTPEVLARKIEVLRSHCADVGRDPAHVEISVQVRAGSEVNAIADEAAALVQAGAQHIIVGFRAPFEASRLEPIAQAMAATLDLGGGATP